MSDDSSRIEQLEAELAQRDRLVDGLQRQLAKVLDELTRIKAELDKKSKKKKKKKKPKKKTVPKTGAASTAPQPPERDQKTRPEKEKEVPRRGPLPDHFERTTEQHQATPQGCCSHPQVQQIANKVIEQRDYIPARVEVRRIELEQWQCRTCEALHRAPMPAMALPTGPHRVPEMRHEPASDPDRRTPGDLGLEACFFDDVQRHGTRCPAA